MTHNQARAIKKFPHLESRILGVEPFNSGLPLPSPPPRENVRSVISALRCLHLIDNEGTCQTKERKCSVLSKTTLLKCMVCQKHEEKPELTEDEKLCLGF